MPAYHVHQWQVRREWKPDADGARPRKRFSKRGEAAVTREQAIEFVSYLVDDALNWRRAKPADVNPDDRLVGWQVGLETLFVVVRSHRSGVKMTDEAAKNLARHYLTEIGWFGEESIEAHFIF